MTRRLYIAFVLARAACADETLVLQSKFVDDIKNKATISVQLQVDVFPKQPHRIASSGDDGDIHMAGRAGQVGLPLVAEIMNARTGGKAAFDSLQKTKAGGTIDVTGVWRIWFEHLGQDDMVQFANVPKPTSSNPDHLFEIHPITQFGAVDAHASIDNIIGYDSEKAKRAFASYEDTPCTIVGGKKSLSITSAKRGFNYVGFFIEITGKPKAVDDAILVLANVFETDSVEDPLTEKPRRMIFIKGTKAADALKGLGQGERLHVLGIPRVNLAEASQLATAAGPDGFSGNLPYEMIIVGIIAD